MIFPSFDKAASLLLANSSLWRPFQQTSIPQTATSSGNDFSWDAVPADEKLVYHDCYHGFHCARLLVPMDWTAEQGSDDRTVEIAVVRLAATVPVTDERYGGAVMLNPGGPGGSGVGLLLREGKHIQTIVSAGPDTAANATAKHFDIISFDPRGVNNTKPTFTCFPDYISRLLFHLEDDASGIIGSSDMAFSNHWVKIRTLADECSKRAVAQDIGEHMTTAAVARDMIELAERHGEWRESEALALLSSTTKSNQKPITKPAQLPETLRYHPGQEKLQYWGFSYGTILGATLAAMYPEHMHRTILDGVADSHDYYAGNWSANLFDTDMQLLAFGEYCWMAGSQNCAMYHEDGPAVILSRFAAIVQKLKQEPIGVAAQGNHSSDLATYSDLKRFLWMKAYSPLREFHNVAEVLHQLENGNATALVLPRRKMKQRIAEGLSEQCMKDGAWSLACDGERSGFDETVSAGILCTDAVDQTNVNKEQYWEYAQSVMKQSQLMGETWAQIRLPCTAWHARPKWRYEGNFTAETAHPILWIGNTADNATPLRNAHKMAKGFPGSVVLTNDAFGHCTFASVSFCTARTVRKYFQTGELPEKGKVCESDRVPLDGFSEEENPKIPDGETDEALWNAMVQLVKDGGGA